MQFEKRQVRLGDILLLNVDLDDRDRTARIAKELAASADF